jgi:hypothetical protein
MLVEILKIVLSALRSIFQSRVALLAEEDAARDLCVSAQMLRAFAHQIPAQFSPKVALPCPPRDQSCQPFPVRSVVDRHYCGGQGLPAQRFTVLRCT